ncbi:MAG: hypothetical protein MJ161_01425 [Clostridia bacterium]|nr:hypothetical protein [Clostridia bacterium]
MSKLFRHNWISAIIINAVILAATLICTDIAYETNDDYVVSLRIVDGYPFSSFINYFFCRILMGIQTIMPGTNAFVLVQMALSWFCFVCITRVFMDSFRSRAGLIAAVLILTVFAGDHYSIIQFTKTSALVLTTGMLLLVHAMISRKNAGWYVIAFIFIYLGTWLRDMNLIVAIGCAGIFLIAWVVINRRALIPEGYLTGRRIAVYVICLLLIGGAAGTYVMSMQINKGTPELAEYIEYDTNRTLVTDYPVYEDFCKNREEYEKAGFSENDLYLISNWYLDYDGAASPENLKTISDIYKSNGNSGLSASEALTKTVKSSLKDVRDFNRRGMHLILIGLLFLAGLILYKPRYCLYLLGACVFAAVLYCYLYYVGRPLYRATYIADFGTIIWMLYYADGRYLRKPELMNRGGKKEVIMCAACAALMLLCQLPVCKADIQLHDYAVSGQTPAEITKLIDSRQDNFYVFGKGTRGLSEYYAKPLDMPDRGYQKNALGFGSWGTRSPYLSDKMAAYGLSNTFADLIDNDRAFIFEDKNVDRLTEYMNKWYADGNTAILLEKTGEVGGHSLWKMVFAKDDRF